MESYFRKYREKIDELCHKIVSEEDWMSCLRRLRIDDMHPEVEAMRGGLVLKRTKILFMYVIVNKCSLFIIVYYNNSKVYNGSLLGIRIFVFWDPKMKHV